MRKLVLAMFLALTMTGLTQTSAMDGFDLGDMPPLPPPLLDADSAGPLAPPPSGVDSPLIQGGSTGFAPVAAPPLGDGYESASGGDLFTTPAPPPLAPPPIAPPPVAPDQPITDMSGIDSSTLPQIQPVALDETPQPGKITGGRVNVRAGPNTQYESVAVLTTGAPVTVLAKHGDWYKIVFPADQLASIHKNMVNADITGEIPETGLPGVVSQDNADVHAFYWDKSTVVGKLNRGDPVVIKQERGQWYRIDAPATARAYVFAQYVRIEGGGPVVADAAPAPFSETVDLSQSEGGPRSEVKLTQRDKDLITLKEGMYKRQQERYEAEREAEERAIQEAIEAHKRQAEQLDLALQDLDERLSAIDQETSQRLNYQANIYAQPTLTTLGSAAWAPPDPVSGGYTGWVENIGRVGSAPSAHRLTKGGEIRFYLRSSMFNLDEYVNRRIWLNGQIEPASGASAAVLNVDQIRILTELEIAEDMRRMQQEYPAEAMQAPYADYNSYGSYYESVPTYDASYGGSYGAPTGGYGDPYAQSSPDTSVYGGTGTYDGGATYTVPNPQPQSYPPQPGYGQQVPPPAAAPRILTPSDPSQLPDVVSAGMNPYPYAVDGGGELPTFDMGGGMGEVDTDLYERPVITEIAP